jgi:hypothetical protein
MTRRQGLPQQFFIVKGRDQKKVMVSAADVLVSITYCCRLGFLRET